ncbi:hypothetical protein ACXO6L_001778 [Campylobacter jejuni]
MEESIERRINEIYQETLKQNFDERYDIAIILSAVSREELFLNYCLIAGFFGFIGIWGFDSNLNALKYYANLYSKEFIRKRIFG